MNIFISAPTLQEWFFFTFPEAAGPWDAPLPVVPSQTPTLNARAGRWGKAPLVHVMCFCICCDYFPLLAFSLGWTSPTDPAAFPQTQRCHQQGKIWGLPQSLSSPRQQWFHLCAWFHGSAQAITKRAAFWWFPSRCHSARGETGSSSCFWKQNLPAWWHPMCSSISILHPVGTMCVPAELL